MKPWPTFKNRKTSGRAAFACATMLAIIALLAAPESRAQSAATTQSAILAGGCFWCMEQAFDKIDGVVETTSGYTGGHLENPTYSDVTSETSGHQEALRVRYDPASVSYARLLDAYWRNVDPFDASGQFCDKGDSYRAVIFVSSEEQNKLADASKEAVEKRFGKKVVTEIVAAGTFYPAEDYHQDYHNKNPVRYKYYKWSCGRAQRLQQVWGPPTHS